jgi:signal transduction histidine kinase
MAVWHEIIDALKRIAKGDFNVSLNRQSGFNGQFGEFVQNINHMAHELKQIEQLRQEFISNVSHEFQSPLTSIRGFANALQNEGLSPDERRHYASIIEAESARLSKLSDNLMKLTSLESEHQPFEPREYRLDVQIRRIVLASEPQWLDKGLEMELDLPETTVTADEELMSQVWINLIHNSIKFTPVDGRITIAIERAKDRVAVRVADTGIGMSPDTQKRIFERFYMEDKARSGTNGGSGLGLSIVKRIVELHHGDIRVTSAPGAGSEFLIVIPC